MILQKIWSYITFRKQPEFKDENTPVGFGDPDIVDERSKTERENGSFLKMMHGINRISILMFIVGMILVLIRIFK